jgi:hypothetical protein
MPRTLAVWPALLRAIPASHLTVHPAETGIESIMNSALKNLSACGDVASLRSALGTLCSEFGPVSRLDILTVVDSGKRQAVCLLRLDSSKQEQDMMTKLGAGRFGEDLCIVVEMGMPN